MHAFFIALAFGANLALPSAAIVIDPGCPTEQYVLIDPSSRPATRNCEKGGYLASPNIIATPDIPSLNGCINECKNMQPAEGPKCQSFGYSDGNSSDSKCVLYGKKLINQKYRMRSQDLGTIFSNMRCYKCQEVIGCGDTENAIENGNFVSGGSNGDGSEAARWTIADQAQGETKSFREVSLETGNGFIHVEPATGNTASNVDLAQTLTCMQPAVDYDLSFDVFGSGSIDDEGPLTKINVFLDNALVATFKMIGDNTYTNTIQNMAVDSTMPEFRVHVIGPVAFNLDNFVLSRSSPI